MGGIGAEVENLLFLKKTADKLLGEYEFSVVAAGAQQMKLAAVSAQLGGHVRVGLEDSLFIARRELATSNAQQVEKISEILALQGNEIATPDEARSILGLKGADKTKIQSAPEPIHFAYEVVAEPGPGQSKRGVIISPRPDYSSWEVLCDEGTGMGGDDAAPSPLGRVKGCAMPIPPMCLSIVRSLKRSWKS